MAQGYYSLQEAAQFLGVPADELKQMAQRNQLRSFQDRGTLRFRIPDIQEMARQRGMTSDPELKLAEPTTPKVTKPVEHQTPRVSKPSEPPRTPSSKPAPPEVFGFALDDSASVNLGEGFLKESPSGAKKGPKSDGKHGKSPAPKPGSDSDVKLVAEGGVVIPGGSDSDVKLVGHDSDVKVAPTPPGRAKAGASSPKPKKSSKLAEPQPADSGVRLVPMDSDSDVKIVGAGADEISFSSQGGPEKGDSDIRLEKFAPPPPSSAEAMLHTEEINLDEEIKKQEAKKQPPQAKVKPKSKVKFPTTSPFELSDSDLDSPSHQGQAKVKPDSSDFDLRAGGPSADSSGSIVLEPSGDSDFDLGLADDSALQLAADSGELKGPSSGINLSKPGDQGISLEENETSDMDFELSLEEGNTPKPAKAQGPPDSDSEFELSLDVDDSAQMQAAADSDSEFELTLDDSSGEISGIGGPQAKADSDSGEKDIFETDFEVPALDDESGSQVAALDTDLDSSDFDIAMDESGSQVIALDEEATDDAAATVAAKPRGKGKSKLAADEDFANIDLDEEGQPALAADDSALAGPVREVVREKLIEPAPWGVLPVIFMLPCVLIMCVVALMGFEMVQSSAGHKDPGFLTKTIADLMGKKIK